MKVFIFLYSISLLLMPIFFYPATYRFQENVPRVVSIAFVLHSSERELFICQPGAAR